MFDIDVDVDLIENAKATLHSLYQYGTVLFVW